MKTSTLKDEIKNLGYYAWYFSERSADGELHGTAEDWRTIKCPWHNDGSGRRGLERLRQHQRPDRLRSLLKSRPCGR